MTIRKQLIIITSAIIFAAVLVYSVMSTVFVDRAFGGYVEGEYEETVERIKAQAAQILKDDENKDAAAETLSVHLNSLIGEISVVNADGEVVVSVRETMPMMRSPMMQGWRAESDYYDVYDGSKVIGTLIIERNSAIRNSETVTLFKQSLIKSAVLSGLVSLAAALIIIVAVSSKMTKDLRQTAEAAELADSARIKNFTPSKITEIRAIQKSLESLSTKLSLQRRVRKEKADQLSHEARTPLSVLKTNCEGARDNIIDMDKKRLNGCIAEIDRLTELLSEINGIVEYNSPEARVDKQEFDLSALISMIISGFSLQYEKKGIELRAEGEKDLKITSDKSLISQTIYNLLSNAYKFNPTGGKAEVKFMKKGGKISISVCDSGPGIPEDDRTRVFQAYERGQSVNEIPGDGLGLFIARNNIEALGGKIRIDDSPLGGVCFIIEIPVENS